MPAVWQDWDMEKGSVRDHKRRQTRVILEMLLIMMVRAAFHALMLLPIIWERHALLENSIGVLPDEKISYDAVTALFNVVVGLFPVLTLLEIVLYCLYQCKVKS